MEYFIIIALAYIQNISFSMVSRARNRNNMWYHATCSVMSNGIWFATFHMLVTADMDWKMAIPYIFGTVLGSMTGSKLSIKIEKVIGATT